MSQENGTAANAVEQSRELSMSDGLPVSRSRRGSLSSSRFSGRLSRRSSVRDEVQTLDEFLRKQRVIRYMQEERERAARSKVLREEHDAWVEFRANERSERLKYMTEQEIAELLQREADEALRDKNAAEMAAKRAAEETVRRRQGIPDVRKKVDEEPVARRRAEPESNNAHSLPECESQDLRQREMALVDKCQRLEKELEEAKEAVIQAQEKQALAEMTGSMNLKSQNCSIDDLKRQLSDAQRESLDAKKQLEAARKEVKEQQFGAREKEDRVRQLQKELQQAAAEKETAAAAAAAATAQAQGTREANKKVAEEAKKAKAALVQEQTARKNADKKVEELEKQLNAGTKKGDAKNADAMKRAKEELQKEQELRSEAQSEAAALRAALAEEKAAREAVEARQQASREPVVANTLDDEVARLQQRIVELEEEVERLRKAHAEDQDTIESLSAQLSATQTMLKQEEAGRAKFEELASRAVGSNDGRVPKEELTQKQREVDELHRLLDTAQRDSEAARNQYEREIDALKVYSKRIQEQRPRRLSDAIFSSKDSTPRIRSVMKMPPADLAGLGASPPADSALTAEQVQKLQQDIDMLQQQLWDQKEKEKKVAEEMKNARKEAAAAKRQVEIARRDADQLRQRVAAAEAQPATVARTHEAPASQHRVQPQQLSQGQLVKMAQLEKENEQLRRKYDTLFKAHKQSDVARSNAERAVCEQRGQIVNLEKEIEYSVARAAPSRDGKSISNTGCETQSRAPAALSATPAPVPPEMAKMEKELAREKVAREMAEQRVCEEKEKAAQADKRAAAAEKRAAASVAEAKKSAEMFASAQGGSAKPEKEKKTKCGCC